MSNQSPIRSHSVNSETQIDNTNVFNQNPIKVNQNAFFSLNPGETTEKMDETKQSLPCRAYKTNGVTTQAGGHDPGHERVPD